MSMTKEQVLLNKIKKYKELYYNTDNKEGIRDEEFDELVNKYETTYGKKIDVGINPPKTNKIQLPIYMGSLDKVKDEHSLELFTNKYTQFVISDKIDGVSALYSSSKLYTRGNGNVGSDISHLLTHLGLPKISENTLIRGELVMYRDDFKKYEEMKNARNMVSGIVNSKNVNYNHIKDVKFIAYQYYSKQDITQEEQFKKLQSLGFNTPFYRVVDKIIFEDMIITLNTRQNISKYEMDGIVIASNSIHKVLSDKNPDYMIAFKQLGERREVEVEKVIWNVSKYNTLVPTIQIIPISLSGVVISSTTGFNAEYILTNKIHAGTKMELTRSGGVIPYITKVFTNPNDEPDFPDVKYRWKGKDIEAVEEEDEYYKKRILTYFTTLEIKNINSATIDKFYTCGYTTLKSILNLTKSDLLKMDGIKIKKCEMLYNAIQQSKSSSLTKIMAGSCCFGKGFGEKKFQSILDKYPNILEMKSPEKKILEIKGFKKLASVFVEKIPDFLMFLKEHPEIQITKSVVEMKQEKIYFVPTGFRFNSKSYEELHNQMEEVGFVAQDSITKQTNYVVVLDDKKSTKVLKAEKMGIPIITMEELKNMINKNICNK